MGIFGNRESAEEIEARIRSSAAGQKFANAFCSMLSEGNEHYQWLMVNSKERMYRLNANKSGVQLQSVEVNYYRLKETGTYDVNTETWGFGASGYEDLPNARYASALERYIIEQINSRCPNITTTFNDGWCIRLSETAKKGW